MSTTARKAFTAYSMNLPAIQAEVMNQIKQGLVEKVYRGDVEGLKGKFKEFVVSNNLITDEATAKKSAGGFRASAETNALITKVVGDKFQKWLDLTKEINTQLKAAGAPVDLQPYRRNLKPAASATPTPAGAQGALAAPAGSAPKVGTPPVNAPGKAQ